MMKGYLDTTDTSTTSITVSGLPPGYTSAGYDVYLYADGGNSGTSDKQGQYALGGTMITVTDPPGADFNGTFILSNNGKGNAIVFPDQRNPVFTLTAKANPQESGGRAPVNGMQIVGRDADGPPLAPSAPGAHAPSTTSIRVTWKDAAVDEASYQVEHSPAGANTWTAGPQLPADSTEYLASGLTAGTNYDFRIKALGTGGADTSVTMTVATLKASE
jgi:hypothetical protein